MSSRDPRRPGSSLLELLVVVAIVAILLGLSLAAIQRTRTAAARTQCLHQLRQHGLAFHQFHTVHSRLPAGIRYQGGNDPYPYMTWMAQLLPYLEQAALWEQTIAAYSQDRWFLSAPPHVGVGRPLAIFSCPADARTTTAHLFGKTPVALTSYLGVNGTRAPFRDGLLFIDSAVRYAEITDGLSTTLLVGERPASADLRLGWWYAGTGQDHDGEGDSLLGTRTKNMTEFGPDCPVGPYAFQPGRFDDPCAAFHFWSPHSGGAHFLLADGSACFLAYSAQATLPALGTRAGREVPEGLD